jgi:hypothetical protein
MWNAYDGAQPVVKPLLKLATKYVKELIEMFI